MKKREKGQKTGIVFVADHWREYTGGIDVFNEKLCEEMAYVVDCSEVSTICLIFGTMCTQYRNDYEEKGIYLVSYRTAEDEILDEAIIKELEKRLLMLLHVLNIFGLDMIYKLVRKHLNYQK